MSGPTIGLTVPDRSLFKFPPHNLPAALPPPSDEATWKSPFPIDSDVYNRALDVKVPLTIASTYVVTVLLINAYNRRQGNKPWAVSKTRPFKFFVVVHNVLLAVYSGVTFYAMCRAINATWPGLDNSNGLAGVADSLCKINGPRGLGDAVFYNSNDNVWQTKNTLINLLPEGTPDTTDVGRLWNEGLAFWGWFFYLSKFYEVIDTAIIVMKGKRSATLQTYHHAGAMLCMWAGIRYMSPPIWMFVFINSFIHTLMYTYFTLSAINIRVPNALKRTLTTMQIAQFVFGASYAALHLFVKYDVPVATAYTIFHPISSIVAKAASTASSAASVATPTESYGAILRRILLRAAGDEGVAENVRDKQGNLIMPQAKEAIQKYHEETRYRTDYTPVNCLDTTGQSFAVWLNILYLFPLTVLFVRFFVRAYIFRTGSSKPSNKRHAASRAAKDAAHGTNREVEHAGKKIEKKISHLPEDIKAAEKKFEDKLSNASFKDFEAEIRRDLQALKEGKLPRSNRPVSDRVQSFERKMTPTKKSAQQIKEEAADSIDELKENVKQQETTHDDDDKELAKDSAPESASVADLSSSIESPSKKKKRKNKKNKNKQATGGVDNVDDHTDAAESGSEHEHTDPEDLLKESLKKGGAMQDLNKGLKKETDKA